MEHGAFDALTRRLARGGSRRAALGVLLGISVSAVLDPADARRRRKGRRQRRGRAATVAICHNGETIQVDRSAVPGLLLNGDTVGACATTSGAAVGGGDPRQDECARLLMARGCDKAVPSISGAYWVCAPNTNLQDTDLHGCILQSAILNSVDFSRANLVGANLVDATMENAILTRAKLHHANMIRTRLIGAQAELVELQHANLPDAKLIGAQIVNASLWSGTYIRADFTNANLTDARLHDSDFTHANFQNANLSGAGWGNAIVDRTICPDGTRVPLFGTCCNHLNGHTTPWCHT